MPSAVQWISEKLKVHHKNDTSPRLPGIFTAVIRSRIYSWQRISYLQLGQGLVFTAVIRCCIRSGKWNDQLSLWKQIRSVSLP